MYKQCCDCNHDYDYYDNVIGYNYFGSVTEHDYLAFLTNIIQFKYDYSKVVDNYT